jgi:hypothetical protein
MIVKYIDLRITIAFLHRFKMGDASIAFLSKYQSDRKDNLRTDGYDMTGVDYGDDSLS